MKGSDWCFHLIQPQTWDDFSMTSSQFLVWFKHQQVLPCSAHSAVCRSFGAQFHQEAAYNSCRGYIYIYPNFWRSKSHSYIMLHPSTLGLQSQVYLWGQHSPTCCPGVACCPNTPKNTWASKSTAAQPLGDRCGLSTRMGMIKQMVSNVMNFHVHIQ